MNKNFKNKLIIGLMSAIAFTNAHASIIGGSVTVIAAPSSVVDDLYQTNVLLGFDEQKDVTLAQNLSVDFLASTSAAGTVSAGTVVNSYYFFLDPTLHDVDQAWSIIFDETILAVIYSTDLLPPSDNLLGLAGTAYGGGFVKRGFEGPDAVSLINSTTLQADLRTAEPGDWFRVVTVSAVPVPSAVWLFGSGLLGLVGVARRRNK